MGTLLVYLRIRRNTNSTPKRHRRFILSLNKYGKYLYITMYASAGLTKLAYPCIKIYVNRFWFKGDLLYKMTNVLMVMMSPRGGTLGVSGWECAAGTLEPLAYTRASSAEFCYLTPE